MNYKVLYRKYRPDNFENIVDQEYIIKILKSSIKNQKISHAYIFSGPRGTGKTSTAKIFAKAINCLNYTEKGSCGTCEACQIFNNNPDIIEIDAASNNGVDEIRELVNNVKLSPASSKYKVYIIDEVHMLTTNAFNAFLLTLEDPPQNIVFILATTNIESVPITILSRCQRFDFKKISEEAIVARLKYICEQENISITSAALKEIALLADGGLRDALGILDQISSEYKNITEEVVQKNYLLITDQKVNEIIQSFIDSDVKMLVNLIDDLRKKACDYKNVVKKLISFIRDKIIFEENNIFQKGEIFKKIIFELNDSLNKVNVYIDPYILLEMIFVSYMQTKTAQDTEKAEDIIISKENYFPGNNFDYQNFENFKKIRINNCFVNPQKKILTKLQTEWSKVKNNLDDNKLLSLLIDAEIVAASEKIVIIATATEGTAELINLDIENLEEKWKKYSQEIYNFIAISLKEWENIKKEYIKNLKVKKKYDYMEEMIKKPKLESSELKKLAETIFESDKIEIN